MKQALCVQSYDQLSNLIRETHEKKEDQNVPSIETKMVSREICENPENGHQQLIPYVTFYAVNPKEGKLMFIQYQRKDQGEGEERLAGKTSIGFGGHIDQPEDIVAEEVIQNEDGSTSYKMTLQNLIDTGYKCAAREIKEELSIDLSAMDVNIYNGDTAFFMGDLSEEVNRVHLGLSIQVEMTPEKFDELKAACVFNQEEIQKLDTLGVNLDVIIEEMDLTVTINKITDNLKNEHGLEDWSCRIFNYVTRNVTNKLMYTVTYKDMISIAKSKIVQRQEEVAQEETVH